MFGRQLKTAGVLALLLAALFSIPGCSGSNGAAPGAGLQESFVDGAPFKGQFGPNGNVTCKTFLGATVANVALSALGGFDFSFFTAFIGTRAIMELSGFGNFLREADNGNEGTGPFPLRALYSALAGGRTTVYLTWFSTFVYHHAFVLAGVLYWMPFYECIALAAARIGNCFGLPADAGTVEPAPTSGVALKLWLIGAAFTVWALDLGVSTTELITLCALGFATGVIDNIGPCGALFFLSGAALAADPMDGLLAALILFVGSNPNSPIGDSDPDYLDLRNRMQLFVGGVALVAIPIILALKRASISGLLEGDEKGIVAYTRGPVPNPLLEVYDENEDLVQGGVSGQEAPDRSLPKGVHRYIFPYDPGTGSARHRCRVVNGDTGTFDSAPVDQGADGPATITDTDMTEIPTSGGSLLIAKGDNFDPCDPPPPSSVQIAGTEALGVRVVDKNTMTILTPPGTNGASGFTLNGNPVNRNISYTDDGNASDGRITDNFARGRFRIVGLDIGERPNGTCRYAAREDILDAGRISNVSYVQDFDVEVAQTAFIADPTIGTVQDGVILDVVPTVSADRRYITLGLQPLEKDLMVGGKVGPPDGTDPAGRRGFAVIMNADGGAVAPDGKYFVTVLCWSQQSIGAGSGTATFDAATGTFRIDGGLTEHDQDGKADPTTMNLSATGSYTTASDGTLTITGLPEEAGILGIRGGVTRSGFGGALSFHTRDKVGMILFTKLASSDAAPVGSYVGSWIEQENGTTWTGNGSQLFNPVDGRFNSLSVSNATAINGEVVHEGHSLTENSYFVRPGGAVFDRNGDHCGQIGADGTWLGSYRERDEDRVFTVPLIAVFAPTPTKFTRRSMPCDYKTLAKGIDLGEGGLAPSLFIEVTTLLGNATPSAGGITVAGFDFDPAGTFTFETIKSKTRRREEDDSVPMIPLTTSGIDTGFGYGYIGSTLYVFPYPFEGETKCMMIGCMRDDGEFGTLRSTLPIGAAWCAVIVKDRGVTPDLDGTYNAQFMCEQFGSTPSFFTINGGGPYTVDATAGTIRFVETQVGTNELLETFPSSVTIDGSFTQSGNCVLVAHELFDGQAFGPFPFCGLATNDGSSIFLMDAVPNGLTCLYVITRNDPIPITPPPPARSGKFCGLELDMFPGLVKVASVAYGRISLGATTVTQTTTRESWSNLVTSPPGTSFETFSAALTWLIDRTYEFTIDQGRSVTGAANTALPGAGSQQTEGGSAPEGNITVTDTSARE